jgi:hypothetical protein
MTCVGKQVAGRVIPNQFLVVDPSSQSNTLGASQLGDLSFHLLATGAIPDVYQQQFR